nr:zinc finger and SCAN domain-containing protein 2-like [Dermacentor andersoni]
MLRSDDDTCAYKEKTEGNSESEGGEYKLLTVHQLSDKTYLCRICAKAFGKRSRLMAHLRSHKESELHMCNLCPESFPSMLDVLEHMSGHSTKTWFHCPLCICSFSSAVWLQRHNVNIHDADVSPSVSGAKHQHQHALNEVACLKYATAEFPNVQPLSLEAVIVDLPDDKRPQEPQGCDEAVVVSEPSTRCANGPATQSIDACSCSGKSSGSGTLQNCREIALEKNCLSDTLPYHTSEDDARHLASILADDIQETSLETAIFFNAGLSEGAHRGKKTSNPNCVRGGAVPLEACDSDHHQGVFGGVAASERHSSFRKTPDDQIIHRPAGIRGGDVQSQNDVRPYASNTASNLCERVGGTHVKEEPPTSPNARLQPVSSRKRKQPQKLFLCPHCGEEFKHKSTFGSHVATHSAVKPFPCTLCSRTFPHQNSLNGHCWIHATESLVHSKSNWLKTHDAAEAMNPSTFIRNSQRDNLRKCTDAEAGATCLVPAECTAGENHSQRLLSQGEGLTLSATASPIAAAKGGRAAKEQDSFFGHLPTKSKKEERANTPPQVKEEVEAVPEEQPRRRFKCHLCPRDFAQRGSLRDHLKSHGGGKSYECHLCPQTFFYLSNLRRHVRRHSGEKGFECGHCGRQFTRRGSLRYHMARTHSSLLSAVTRREQRRAALKAAISSP